MAAAAAAGLTYLARPWRRPFLSSCSRRQMSRSLRTHSYGTLCCLHEHGSQEKKISNSDGIVSPNNCSKLLQVVLVSPQIPGNTGAIARTCAAAAVQLHLVGPLGYTIDDTKLKRAGLDYWPYVVVRVHNSWAEFMDYFKHLGGDKRLLAYTKRGESVHSEFSHKKGDWLIFGSETKGLSSEILEDCSREGLGGGTIRIPMVDSYVRCLNLSVSVGVALYEAARQLNYEQLQQQQDCGQINGEEALLLTEDIYC